MRIAWCVRGGNTWTLVGCKGRELRFERADVQDCIECLGDPCGHSFLVQRCAYAYVKGRLPMIVKFG